MDGDYNRTMVQILGFKSYSGMNAATSAEIIMDYHARLSWDYAGTHMALNHEVGSC